MAVGLDPQRGFDHGTFAPLVIMYPDANVPIVQLSLKSGYDPATHLSVGRALAPLRDEGVLVIGSGLSYHNLRKFGPAGREASRTFDDWLQDTVLAMPDKRESRLLTWRDAPAARDAHPREDHLIPLMVAVGAAENESATVIYHEEDLFNGVTASSFRLGEALCALPSRFSLTAIAEAMGPNSENRRMTNIPFGAAPSPRLCKLPNNRVNDKYLFGFGVSYAE
jgi:aromatic ring-opening dioxygenase catalytic subunit (LigB family)